MKIDKRAYSGAIYDIIKFEIEYDKKFVLPNDIKPLYDYWGFSFGKAFTARGDKTSNPNHERVAEMIDYFNIGDVYILQANDNSRAHFGDIMATFLKRAGAEGVVLQGWTRDSVGVGLADLPVWCKGTQPQDSADRWGITSYLDEIVIGNIFITPRDYIFADNDAVLVIKEELVTEVVGRLPDKLNYEERIKSEIEQGKSAEQILRETGRW
jgi:regulator of RNase E activity RraA